VVGNPASIRDANAPLLWNHATPQTIAHPLRVPACWMIAVAAESQPASCSIQLADLHYICAYLTSLIKGV
jgi:hypothetical protein